MIRTLRVPAAVLVLAFLAFHLPFLPSSLEDLDSINFALGVRDFDVAEHQPHPPGYPLFIVAGTFATHLVGSEVEGLSIVSVVAGALSLLPLIALFRTFSSAESTDWMIVATALLAVTAPLFWITAARPLSDAMGLAAALAVQVLILRVGTLRSLIIAAACAGFAAGIRSQLVWLTAPLLVFAASRLRLSWRDALQVALGYGVGIAAWLVPLVIVSGGPLPYWRALFAQGSEDFTGVVMLWTTPTARQAAYSLLDTFVTPWGTRAVAVAILVLATVGTMRLLISNRLELLVLATGFGAYLVFHLLFQETATTRYALPLVVPIAYLAGRGAEIAGRRASLVLICALAAINVAWTQPILQAYASADAPAFQLLEGFQRERAKEPSAVEDAPVLAMHRREDLDLRRPLDWVGDAMPAAARRLNAPPKHEWLELVKYWNSGGRSPIWFVADPLRSDLDLVDHDPPVARYRWPFTATQLIGGVRPNVMDWYVLREPSWYVGEGWALTPESAGVAGEDGKGPGKGPIEGWIRRSNGPVTLMIGGRNLKPGGPSLTATVRIDDHPLETFTVAPGFFLKVMTLEAANLTGMGEFAKLTIASDGEGLAIEQFDAEPAGTPVFGFGDGWHEEEYNAATGVVWRWTSDRSLLRIRPEGKNLVLTLRGETDPATDRPHLIVRAGDAIVADEQVDGRFELRVALPKRLMTEPEATVAIETDQIHVPAETLWRSTDQRRLGLKIFACELTPAS